jgi:hypothetical protein
MADTTTTTQRHQQQHTDNGSPGVVLSAENDGDGDDTDTVTKYSCRRCRRLVQRIPIAVLWHFNGTMRQVVLGGLLMLLYTIICCVLGAIMFIVANDSTTLMWKYTFGLVFHSDMFDIDAFNADVTEPDTTMGIYPVQTFYMFSAVGVAIVTIVLMLSTLIIGMCCLCCARTRSGYLERKLESILVNHLPNGKPLFPQQQQE